MNLVQKKNSILLNDGYVYFTSFCISTAAIKIEDTTGCYVAPSVGIQNLKKITKCEIDVLGNVQEIKKRPKQPQPLKMLTDKERAEKRKKNQNK